MQLSDIELKNLISFRNLKKWISDNLPLSFQLSLDETQLNLLIHELQHFHLSVGATTQLYSNGAIIIANDEEDNSSMILQLERLINYNIKSIHIVSTKDFIQTKNRSLKIAQVTFLSPGDQIKMGFSDRKKEKEVLTIVKKTFQKISLREFQSLCARFNQCFLETASKEHISETIILFYKSQLDINVKVELQKSSHDKQLKCIALANKRSSKTGFFLNLIKVFQHHKIKIENVHSVYIPEDIDDERVLTLFYVNPKQSHPNKTTKMMGFSRLLESLSMVQWFEFENPTNRDFLYKLGFSIHHSLLLRSIEEFLYQMLVNIDSNLYTPSMIHEALHKHPEVSRALVTYFSHRFNPIFLNKNLKNSSRKHLKDLIRHIDSGIVLNDQRRKTILNMAVTFIDHIQKTNYYVIRRSALSFRIDPNVIDEFPFKDRNSLYPEIPFGIFYIKGKNFIAFNVRFRDLSRGGVRTLLPSTPEQIIHQQKDVFRECYNLAFTQQAKNKDIPEGGSKSVIFIKPYVGLNRDLELEKKILTTAQSKQSLGTILKDKKNILIRRQLFDAQQSFCDTLLDIIIWNDQKRHLQNDVIRDYYNKEELVFLGPDENMTDQMITWISGRSYDRKYKIGKAFMSGKKEAGINHKEYGVTSLGVHEYLKEALKATGIDKEKFFTAKVSGGPDGDVAGNELVNLVDDLKSKVRILYIQDGTGSIYDPEGLHHGELKKLFKNNQGVTKFDAKKLHKDSFILHIHERREKTAGVEEILQIEIQTTQQKKTKIIEKWIGASDANRIYHHFLHQLQTDVFLPCGGRPRSLNRNNWQEFLSDKKRPSSKIIVEGANLYLSSDARYELEKKGVLIIKDASANKCGVICSSFEILSGLLVDEKEFKSIKDNFVKDVLKILKIKARKEAQILVSALQNKQSIIDLSDLISEKINYYTDMIYDELMTLPKGKDQASILKKVIEHHFPLILKSKYFKRILALPPVYLNAIIASSIASSLIYKYGVDYRPSIVASIHSEIKNGILDHT